MFDEPLLQGLTGHLNVQARGPKKSFDKNKRSKNRNSRYHTYHLGPLA